MAASLPSPSSPSARRHGLILILLTVFAFNVMGDGLRDALDPRLKN